MSQDAFEVEDCPWGLLGTLFGSVSVFGSAKFVLGDYRGHFHANYKSLRRGLLSHYHINVLILSKRIGVVAVTMTLISHYYKF